MKRTKINQTKHEIGKRVTIRGWVQTIRDQGGIIFLLIRDESGIVQCVVTEEKSELLKKIHTLNCESVVKITGKIEKVKQAPGGVELKTEKLTILSTAASPLPIQIVKKNDEETNRQKRLDWRWLDLRKPERKLIFKVWTTMEQAFVNYCSENGYIRIHSPKLMSTASESGAELFEIKYFDQTAYLAQSPQFYKQMAMASGFEKVFEIGPVFRANPSFTPRHDTEFTGYDIEISFIKSHQDVIREEEKIIQAMLSNIVEKYGDEIKKDYARKLPIPTIPFPQLTMKEAKRILSKLNLKHQREGDLSPEEEREISRYVEKEYGHEFVFITDFPTKVRPFYHMRYAKEKNLTKSFDLLWNGIEITTGAQREHRYEILVQQAKEDKMDLNSLKNYLNFFKYGCPPHGGLGLGPSRMLMKIFDIDNVREVTYLYRGVKRLTP
jgi:aspartyl-tRNA synthetase